MGLTVRETWRLALRSLFVQVLLSYRTMQGAGYLFTLWPWLRRKSDLSRNVQACAGFFNSHPVLSTLAAGALLKRVEDGDAVRDPEGLANWQSEVSGPLGMVGDMLIWDRWKPIIFAAGLMFLLWQPRIEFWAAIAIGCLLLYNGPLFQVRVWGAQAGYQLGSRIIEVLSNPLVSKLRRGLSMVGAAVAGTLVASVALRTASEG
ncbi:PTS system mannose/fructose/sorbose family transporter subunit IID, partial [bacterium]|nr:PTS system mannose/fructose/sorbose family transporter subunit IID [bacterium]MBU1983153.1 PTS system mannose/fructose/sorbose family transporter subunit IID [bacterium]